MSFLARVLRIVVREAAIVAAHEVARTLVQRALRQPKPRKRQRKRKAGL